MGTYGGGLNRFDPQTESFTHYRRNPDDPTSLSQDSVTVILEDHTGTLWVGTHSGLNRFDRDTGTFTHLRHDPADPTSLSNDQVRALYEDREDTLWVGTRSPFLGEDGATPGSGGLSRFDRKAETFTNYRHDPNDPQSLIDNHVTAIYEDSRGIFWVGTVGDGLHTMNREAGTFVRHRYDPADPGKLSRPYMSPPSDEDISLVSFIFEDDAGALWIGADSNQGLNRYDPVTGSLASIDLSSWHNSWVWKMHQSQDGTLWITTLGGGAERSRTADLLSAIQERT